MQELLKPLLDITKQTSNFETSRNYISLSNIVKPVEDLVNDYKNGYVADETGLIKCRLGYWMEKGLKERLLQIEGIEESYEVVVPGSNGLIKGHPDFKYLGMPGDCKSFALDDYLPDEKKIPKKIYWQMNAYMLYTNRSKSVIVCESRESGKLKTIQIFKNNSICEAIKEKVAVILAMI